MTQFIIWEPEHFHATAVLEQAHQGISELVMDPEVWVFHSPGNDLKAFNGRAEHRDPFWEVHTIETSKPLEEALNHANGNVFVAAGNNGEKMNGIYGATKAGFPLILADKPWVIQNDQIQTLLDTIAMARGNGTILYDLMTERCELGTQMQQSIMLNSDLFGILEQGTADNPAIIKDSTHILDKSAKGVIRPPTYFDMAWQGEGIVDVTAHLVDMANMLIRPTKVIIPADVALIEGYAKRWNTSVPQADFEKITGTTETSPLNVPCNGSFLYSLDGTYVRIKVAWDLNGEDDGHYSRIEGTKARVEVEKPKKNGTHQEVYITSKDSSQSGFKMALVDHCNRLSRQMVRNISYTQTEEGSYKLNFPADLYTGHFDHFGEVVHHALSCLAGQEIFLRELEDNRLLTKYHLTTGALEMVRKG
jgi:hypothetical protein